MNREPTLNISELYYSIQGEGVTVGVPSIFVRLQGCILNCMWCDTVDVWKQGTSRPVKDIADNIYNIADQAHSFPSTIVLTGGSPLLQQENLIHLITKLRPDFRIELENECVIMPNLSMMYSIDQWNNSPKLSNSGVERSKRYKKDVIYRMARLDSDPNQFNNKSWFKFVVECEEDWEEIKMDFIEPNLIRREQVILMPQAISRMELKDIQQTVVQMALKHNVRYSPREHITIWNQRTGV